MEKFHIGSGVYRAKDNTMLYEVYTPEQMEAMQDGDIYAWMAKNKLKGGFHGIKVIGSPNVHGRIVLENLEQILPEQKAVIEAAMNMVNPPEVVYDPLSGMKAGVVHDLSKNDNLVEDDGVGAVGSGNNEWDSEEAATFDESFMEADGAKHNGYREDGSEASGRDGEAVESDEPKKPAKKAGGNGKSNKKPSGKPRPSGE